MSDLQTLTQKIEGLERRVEADLAKRRHSNLIVAIGGGILFIFILVYFSFIHNLVTEVAEPKNLASIASSSLREHLPEAMATVQTQLKDIAPKVVTEVRIQAIKAMPDIRIWMEDEAVRTSERYIVPLEKELGTVIQQGIVADREAFDAFIKDPDNPQVQKRFREVVQASVKSYFDNPMVQADLKSYADVLKAYDTKLEKLRAGEDLTPEEKLERQVILAVRELARRSEKPVEFKP